MDYVNENDLREEILKIQKSNRIKEILAEPTDELLLEMQELLDNGYTEKYSKTKFGEMILQIVKRRATSPKFSGYSYKEEFYSNAIEKIMSYAIKNFNDNYINPRTGEKSKAFSYITEIATRAFNAIINEYIEEQEEINALIPYDSLYQYTNQKVENTSKHCYDNKETYEMFLKIHYEDGLMFDNKRYDRMLSILEQYKDKKVKIEYPLEYKIKLDEFEKIKQLKFTYLDLVQIKENKYIPSFPKKAKRIKEDLIEEWC